MTTKPIILFNGPPRSGKDCLANSAYQKTPRKSQVYSFKEPMFEIAAATLGMSLSAFMCKYEHEEGWKDNPTILNGKTVRELLIQISEKFIKPFFGEDYFGQAAVSKIRNNYRNEEQVIYFSDSGFVQEALALSEAFPRRIVVVRLHRDGTSFDGDSRISLPNSADWVTIDLDNNGTVEEALDELNSRITNLGFDSIF